MPRWPKKEGEEGSVVESPQDVSGSEVVAAAPVEPTKKEKAPLKFLPYEGKDKLPAYKVVGAAKDGKKAPIQAGEPRFILARGDRKTFKLIGIYRTQNGINRRLYAVLKPSLKNRPNDKALFDKLKAAGIPGAY